MKHQELSLSGIDRFEARYYLQDSPEPVDLKQFPAHVHDELEIYVHLEGDASFSVEKHIYPLQPGSVVVSKPNEVHNCILHSDRVFRHMCFWFQPEGFLFQPFLAHPYGSGNLIEPAGHEAEIFEILRQLAETPDDDVLSRYALIVRFLALETRLLAKTPEVQPSAPMPALLRSILGDIDENFVRINDLSYFTEKYFVSLSTLNRLFRTNLHTSPKHYLETKKFARSRQLLKAGYRVTDACFEAGFGDYSGFIRQFRKRFGVTPRRFREGYAISFSGDIRV